MSSHVRHGRGTVRPYVFGHYRLPEFVQDVFGAKVLERHDMGEESAHVVVVTFDSVWPVPPVMVKLRKLIEAEPPLAMVTAASHPVGSLPSQVVPFASMNVALAPTPSPSAGSHSPPRSCRVSTSMPLRRPRG